MNTDFIASNLKEAGEELRRLTERAESSDDLLFESFHAAMAQIYHHLNSAWNGRNATAEEALTCADADWQAWRGFPKNLPLIGDENYFDLPEYKASKNGAKE